MAPTIEDVKSVESTSAGPIVEPARDVVIGDAKIADAPHRARDGAHAPRLRRRHDRGIPAAGLYFLGSEDRVMFARDGHHSVYGIGDYIYMDGDFHAIAAYEFTTMTITIEGGVTILLDDEPSFELFMSVLGTPWDETYRSQYETDDDRSDYIPIIYRTREAFSNHLTLGGHGELYHGYGSL